jgi:hypothetical protein
MSDSERGGVHLPGNALGLSSRVVGEKTELTSSVSFVQPGGGSFFAAAHADTELVNKM